MRMKIISIKISLYAFIFINAVLAAPTRVQSNMVQNTVSRSTGIQQASATISGPNFMSVQPMNNQASMNNQMPLINNQPQLVNNVMQQPALVNNSASVNNSNGLSDDVFLQNTVNNLLGKELQELRSDIAKHRSDIKRHGIEIKEKIKVLLGV